MNRIKIFATAFSVAMLCAGFASCSSDEKEIEDIEIPSLNIPKFENESAKYNITSDNSPWVSIELTASGDYIVTGNYYDYSGYSAENSVPRALLAANMLPRVGSAARATIGNFIYGKYRQIGENEYSLEGFGTVKVMMDGSEAASLTVSTAAGRDLSLTAYKASSDADSPLTSAVCRSWNLDEISLRIKFDKDMVFEGRRPSSQVNQLMTDAMKAMMEYFKKRYPQLDDDMDEEDFGDGLDVFEYPPTGLLFTKAGTYMVDYSGKAIGVATWHWTNESKGIFDYAWSYDDSGRYGGKAAVSFEGKTLVIREPHEGYNAEIGMDIKTEMKYFCSEQL